MSKINSKNKGSKAERDLAKVWEQWTGLKFSRTPMSGGWAKSKESFGDLTCTDEKHSRKFSFSIECKSYKGITFNDILKENKSSDILRFWTQAKGDADRCKKLPILFMRENGMSKGYYFVIIEEEMGDYIIKHQANSVYFKMNIPEFPGLLYVFGSTTIFNVPYIKLHKLARKILKTQRSNGK